jgi:hypothetical protein
VIIIKTDRYSKFRKIYRRAQASAAQKNLLFDLTLEQLYRKWLKQQAYYCSPFETVCALTGETIYLGQTRKEQEHGKNTASLDRIDSKKGYTIKNVQWTSKEINFLKNNFDQNKFIKLCKLVANEHTY